MGKAARKPRTGAHEARAVARNLRTSPRKLNLVAGFIRGMGVGEALAQLTFLKKRMAPEVRKLLQSAVANAENNHFLDIDNLYVAEASVGKSLVMKRFRARARGRVGRVEKPFSNMTIVVRERSEDA